MKKDLLFEIGTEELPATNLADIFENAVPPSPGMRAENVLETRFRKVLDDARLTYGSVRVWATARRLVFIAEEVAPVQAAKDIFTKVLSKDEAYGPDGAPTEKFLTILSHRQAEVRQTVIQKHQDRDYVFIKKTEAALPTAKVLPDVFRALVRSMQFPKNMRWGKKWEDGSELYFPRPIRNFLCLYGDQAVSVKGGIAGIPVTSKTWVFSKSHRRSFAVKGLKSYFEVLKKQGVILDPVLRKSAISKALSEAAKKCGGRLYDDPFLLSEVNFLVEAPSVVSAEFDERFLELPQEVLAVSMARKQRIFGVEREAMKLSPVFIGVLDRSVSAAEKKHISFNMGNILHAKLKDSLFFYEEDRKQSLDKKRDELKNLIFLKGAGSMLEKSDRLMRLARSVEFRDRQQGVDVAKLEQAARLCKSDLLSLMVGEFPELQGIMGKYYSGYAEGDKDAQVSLAIGEQYLPRTVQDRLPSTGLGSALSVLDKVDLIVACFGLGLEPSSSMDPYGLRRSASAVIKISLQNELDFSLRSLLAESKKLLAAYVKKDREEALLRKLEDFFKDRFKAVLQTEWGIREDLVEAVCSAKPLDHLARTAAQVRALSKLSGEKAFMESYKVIERLSNILKGNKEPLGSAVDPGLFAEELERGVYERLDRFQEGISGAARAGDIARATSLYAEAFFDILNAFFEKVFVNSEDLNVRKNRLTLLKTVKDLYTRDIADLSKVRQS